jgi:hypothetical protein
LDISLGHVCSLREEQLINSMRSGPAGSSCRACAAWIAARAPTQSSARSVVGIGELRPGLAGARALALVVVGVPGRGSDPGEFIAQRIEGGVGELAEEAGQEFPLVEPWTGRALARFRRSGLHQSLSLVARAHRKGTRSTVPEFPRPPS